ncbi:MAG TPA: HNH endonuclease, partial [Mycobacteriales bacterium]|nr:HNH endonuclease [Mycobacteriales bacterium]
CRRHHRLKDSPVSGWKYRPGPDGRHHWTTPTGHTYSPDPPPKPRPQPKPAIDPDEPPPF